MFETPPTMMFSNESEIIHLCRGAVEALNHIYTMDSSSSTDVDGITFRY